ncbi:HPr family phosphocarrier protein [Geosporobacter ferrireducens]|uniref:Phosphocarrier protein HPr n=1 Tax=Geosporobacter ferrireducens TaxID=1424294 RepID=A0A1D8GD76_9FIRM|nr:HPr family phosphocarrier protein [Geosporobacter ferrireducens]AOT68860.1 phosphocarrier protein HPr [Geosporobacter ferrireducens]MTI54907.1 HPr family phosphocarrier protein [Geosporobacter ferrireducens]
MVLKEVEIKNEAGLHARPATLLIKTAAQFKSDVVLITGNKEVNAKSIMGIMAMGAVKGEKIEVRADGLDEKEALEAIVSLFETNFGE